MVTFVIVEDFPFLFFSWQKVSLRHHHQLPFRSNSIKVIVVKM